MSNCDLASNAAGSSLSSRGFDSPQRGKLRNLAAEATNRDGGAHRNFAPIVVIPSLNRSAATVVIGTRNLAQVAVSCLFLSRMSSSVLGTNRLSPNSAALT